MSVPQPIRDTSQLDADSPSILVEDAQFLFHAHFTRAGSDLVLTGEDGHRAILPDYFKHEQLPTLLTHEGSALTGDVVAALAGPRAPGQYAQAGTGPAPAPADGTLIGRVAAVQGDSIAVRNGVAVTLNVGDAVYKNDVIQTQGNSTVGIIFGDGTTFNLTANARMVLSDFIYNPAPGSANSALINLVQGSFTFIAGEVAKTGDMKIGTPVAAMGIRGTAVQVDIDVNNGETKMSVLVEPSGVVGSFQVYSLSGQLIATVNNSNGVTVVTPAGPLQAVATELQKTPAELQQALAVVQQVFQTQNVGQAILAAQPVPPSPPPTPPQQPGTPDPNDPNAKALAEGTQIELSTTKIVVTATTSTDSTTVDTQVAVLTPSPASPVTPLPVLPPPPPTLPVDVAPTLSGYVVTIAVPSNPPPIVTALSSNGMLAFSDNIQRTGETHSVTATQGDFGHLTVAIAQDTPGTQVEGSIAYTYTVDAAKAAALAANQTHDDTFVITLTDEAGHVTNSTLTVHLAGVNDSPLLKIPSSAANATEGHPLVLASGTTVSDPDLGDIISLTLAVQHGTLTATASNNVTIDQGNGTSAIALHGSVEAINALLSGGINYMPETGYTGADTLAIQAHDLASASDSKTVAITVVPFDDGVAPLAISGSAVEHAVLNAVLGNDPDGGPSTVNYQWLRDGSIISGAIGSTYQLAADDVGHRLTVTAAYVDGQNFAENVTSAATLTVTAVDDGQAPLSISGTPQEHGTLTAVLGPDPDGNPATASYQWLRDGSIISGASASNYQIATADIGHHLAVSVSYTDGQGFDENVTSAATALVGAVNDGHASLSISGPAQEDASLTAILGTDPDGGPSSANYQWSRDGNAIQGATSSSYVLTHDDVGHHLTVTAQYADNQGFAEIVTSQPTATIAAVNHAPTLLAGAVTGAVPSDALTDIAASYLTANHNLIGGLGGTSGYGENVLAANDDGSTSAINIDSVFGSAGLDLFGTTAHDIYINNNGNITFTGPLATFTPSEIGQGFSSPIVAAFWADVDTRGAGSGLVYYDLDSDNHVLTITWDNVGYYDSHSDLLNSFQMQLIGLGNGDFDIAFRYQDINWTTGDASEGAGGLGGIPARAGYSAGDGNPDHYFELPQSGNETDMLGLSSAVGNTGMAGVDVFQVESGAVTTAPVANGTVAFSDTDAGDTHSALATSIGPNAGSYLGSFTIDSSVNESTHSVGWHFTLGSNDVNTFFDPAAQQIRQQDYRITVSDGHPNGSVTEEVGINVASAVHDTFTFTPTQGQQVIFKFDTAADQLDLTGFNVDFSNAVISAVNSGQDTLVDLGHGDSVTLIHVQSAALHASNFALLH